MKKKRNSDAEKKIEELILEKLKENKPESTGQLIEIIHKSSKLPTQQVTEVLLTLEDEHKITFIESGLTEKSKTKLAKQAWYWITITLAITTTLIIFLVPMELIYVRWTLGLTLNIFLPGYAFVKALFPKNKTPFRKDNQTLSLLEIVGLSIGLSLALNAIVGFLLDYLLLGIGTTPMTVSFLAITLTFATVAAARTSQ